MQRCTRGQSASEIEIPRVERRASTNVTEMIDGAAIGPQRARATAEMNMQTLHIDAGSAQHRQHVVAVSRVSPPPSMPVTNSPLRPSL